MIKNSKMHLIIGTAICLATMLLFLLFSNRLPDNVPVQVTVDGSVRNTLPKPLLVFGIPVIFAVVNLVKGSSPAKDQNTSVSSFYVVPGIAIALSILIISFAIRV